MATPFPIRVVSGMRPTGRLHLGHYFGVLVNYLALQEKHQCFFMVADLHAMTTGDLTKHDLATNTLDMFLDWLSVGVNPEKATLFVQSAVPEHCELFALMTNLTSLGWLERNPTYKEQRKELGENLTGSLGFLAYPVLQSVDVCIYKGTHVPVGEDQKPHLEMGRELIRRFNTTFAPIFPEFQAILTPSPKLPGLDNRKMSKSYGNAVEISEDPESIRKKILTMYTDPLRPKRSDPGHPEQCPVFDYHKLFTPAPRVKQIEIECKTALLGCRDDKAALAETIIEWQKPILKRRHELLGNLDYVHETIRKGCEKARAEASKTMEEVRKIVGLYSLR